MPNASIPAQGEGTLISSDDSNVTTHLSPPAYMYAYVTVLNVIIFVVGVIGNVMVLLVIVRMRTLRTRVNYFLASLSVSDLLVLVVCQPSAMLVFYTRDQWLLGHFMCQLVPFLEHWTVHASVLTLLVIGLDRYVTICRPGSPLFPPRPVLHLTVAWVTAGVLAVPFILLTSLDTSEYLDGSSVEVCRTKLDGLWSRLFVTFTFALMFLLPLLLLSFLYASVISRLRRLTVGQDTVKLGAKLCKREETRSTAGLAVNAPSLLTPAARTGETRSNGLVNPATARSRHQVARMLVVIVALFFICFMPFKVLTLWLAFETPSRVESLGFEPYLNLLSLARIVTYINSAGNPIIYAWMSPRFRRAFLLALPRNCRASVRPGPNASGADGDQTTGLEVGDLSPAPTAPPNSSARPLKNDVAYKVRPVDHGSQ